MSGMTMQPAAQSASTTRLAAERGTLEKVRTLMRRHPLGTFGAVVLAIMTFGGVFAPWLAPYDPTVGDATALYHPPSAKYLLGTDAFGRDTLSRLLYGARTSLIIGFGSSMLGVVLGTAVGILGGYFGGWFDAVSQRIMDALLAFPLLLLALAISAVLGPSTINVIIALGIPIIPRTARIARAGTLSLRHTTFIEAARATGCTDSRIIFRHILPNILGSLLVIATAYLGLVIVQEAARDYLGAGIQEPQSSWGLMMSGSATTLALVAPWVVIFPGLAILLTVLASNLLGDAVRDEFDPKMSRNL